jgi:PAS domain S-box-containing protein
MATQTKTKQALTIEVADLRARLEQAETALTAFKNGHAKAAQAPAGNAQSFWRAGDIHGVLLAQVSDAIIAVDNEQRVTYLNAAAARQYGVSEAEAMGCRLSDLYQYQWLQPEDEAAAFAALQERGEWRGENTHVRHDGKTLRVESTVSTLRDDAGNPAGLLAVIRDVTANREAKEALRLHATMLDAVNQAVIATDNDGRITYWNRFAEHLYGWRAEEALGKPVQEITPAQFTREQAEAIMIALQQGQAWAGEFSVQRKDGSTFSAMVSDAPIWDSQGRQVGIVGVSSDITERKEAEARVRQSESQLRRVLDNLFAFVGVMLPDGTLIEANRAPLEAAGLTLDDVIGKKFWECYWWSYAPEAQATMKDAVMRARAGEVVRFDVPVRTAGDDRMWIDFQIAPLRDETGDITHLIPSAMDISARRQAEAQTRRSETMFRRIADANLIGVGIGDTKGRVEYVNDEILRMMGRTREELAAGVINWAEAVAPEDQHDIVPRAETLLREGRVSGYERSFIKPDGTRTPFIGAAALLAPDSDLHVTTLLDISARKQAEAKILESQRALEQSNALLEMVLTSTPAGLAIFDNDLRYVKVNESLARINNRPVEAHIGRTTAEVLGAERAEPIEQMLKHVRDTRQSMTGIEMTGAGCHLLVDFYPVRIGAGEANGVGVTVTDITWRKRREASAAFLAEIGDVLSRLSTPDEIMRAAGEKISAHLNASRVFFIEIDQANELSIVLYDWCKDNLPSTAGRYRISEYSDESFLNTLAAGEDFVINDTADDTRLTPDAAAKFAAMHIGAALNTPYISDGRLKYVLAVQQRDAYDWREDEIDLMHELAARLWPAIERTRAEAALRQSEAQQRLSIQVAQFATADIDYRNNIFHLSREAAQMYGLGDSEMTVPRARVHATFHPDDRAWLAALIAQVLDPQGNGEMVCEHRVVLPQGDVRWLNVRKQIFFDRSTTPAQPVQGILVAQDITERKRIEDRLRQSEERFRLASQAVQAVIYDWDMTSNQVNRSQELFNLLGFSNDDAGVACNPWYLSRVHPDDLTRSVGLLQQAIASGVDRFEDELRLQHKAGHYIWVRDCGLFLRDETGRALRCVGSITDITARRQADEALRESQARLGLALESGRMGAWEWDFESGIEFWTPEQEKLFGLPPGRGVYPAEKFFELVHPEDRARMQQEAQRTRASNTDYVEDEFRILRPNGQVAWIASRARLHRDAQGRAVRMTGVNMDVSERKQAEEALRLSEQRFRRLSDTSVIGIITADLNAITTSNDAFLGMVGYTHEDLRAGHIRWQYMTPPEYAELDQKAVAQLLERGWCDPFEKELIRQDSSRVPILIGAALLSRDPLSWICFVVDLTERKQTEQKLQTANFRFRIAEEAAKSFSYEWDMQMDKVERSAGLQRVLGYAPDELPPTWEAWTGLMHPDDKTLNSKTQVVDYINNLDAHVSSNEYRVRHKDGTYRWLNERSMILRDAQGRVTRLIGQSVDVTDRKQAEEALRASETRYRELNTSLEARVAERTMELAQSREQLRELSAYVVRMREEERTRISREVHDQLGGALTVLKMSLARTARLREGDDELVAQFNDMRTQADGVVKMVRRIASDLRPSVLDDFGLAAAMEWQAQEWSQRTGIACRLDSSLMPESVALDTEQRTAVFRVFQESLTNVARHAHATTVMATLSVEADRLVLVVQDNGQGIDPSAAATHKSMGLLGMRERIREVGGNFEISSRLGQGVTVRVTVPLRNS